MSKLGCSSRPAVREAVGDGPLNAFRNVPGIGLQYTHFAYDFDGETVTRSARRFFVLFPP